MTVWSMRIACWITKATDTLIICNTYCLSTATVVTRTRLNVTLYVRCLPFIFVVVNGTLMDGEEGGFGLTLQF
jgi:hypothetical protein